ncbi:TonB-dependent receptor plug domain-containing protein [Serpens gallinarum]|jgi:hemoglobin/transferrin/lactoferrin receptor protein|uniref:TonB-dependent receptor n=1 Tax=Serpens gallinarum TaxID=2763075 RepID=A0ABR8TPJ0_9PSED|nr:TonB-dependent receptor [Serpens gallinarum]MBD7977675.1 TonB-dependent receptor [Serpens gallinarum]
MTFQSSRLALACLGLISLPAIAESLTLDTTVVTARGYASDSLDTPQAVEVLQPPPASSEPLGSLLRGEPGLAVQSDGAWGQNPVLRGLKKESVVLLVDGVRVNSAQPQGALASFTDLGLVERVEVLKGPSSVLYGSGAMGGVVNVLTPEARFSAQRQQGGRFGLSAGTVDNALSGALLLNDSGPSHGLLVGAAGSDVGDYESPDGDENNTGYRSNSLLFKYQQKIADDYVLRFNAQRHDDRDVWYPASRKSAPPAQAPLLGEITMHSPEQSRELYSLSLDAPLGAGTLSSEIYRQEVFRQIRAYSSRQQRNYVENDVSFVTHGLRSTWLAPLGDNHQLTLGVEGWEMTADPERYMSPTGVRMLNNPFEDGEMTSAGLFVQDEFSLGLTQFTAGLRYDRVEGDAAQKGSGPAAQTTDLKSSDNNLSWSLGVVQPLTAALNAYANFGQAYRSPDMRERFEDAARGDGYYHIGNPQLDPERSTSLEIGLKGRDGRLGYQLAAFHTRIDDYIAGRVVTGQMQQGLPVKRTENVDEVAIYGLEGNLDLPLGAFMLDAGFTWLRGENKQYDEPLYQMPAHELRLGIGQPAERGLSWHTGLRAVTEQDRIARQFSGGSEDTTSGYVVVDARLGYGVGSLGVLDTARLDLRLNNLLNKRYHEHLADGISGQELAMPGRGAVLALSGSF